MQKLLLGIKPLVSLILSIIFFYFILVPVSFFLKFCTNNYNLKKKNTKQTYWIDLSLKK